MVALKQVSFAGGELAPNVYGRSDLSKWLAGLATCRNFWINRFGNAENRPGTDYIDAPYAISKARAIPFDISTAQAYVLYVDSELLWTGLTGARFYGMTIRPYANGAPLTVTVANLPAWNSGTTYQRGQIVAQGGKAYISASDGNLNNTPTASYSSQPQWFLLPWLAGSVNVTACVAIPVPEVQCFKTSPLYLQPDTNPAVFLGMDYAQVNEALYLASHSFRPMSLEYHGDTWWRINTNVLANTIGQPGVLGVTGSGTGTIYKYAVAAIGSDLTTQGPLAMGPALAVSSIVDSGTIGSAIAVTTSAAHHLVTNDLVQFTFAFNGLVLAATDYTVTVTSPTQFTINVVSTGSALTTATPGNYQAYFTWISSGTPSSSSPNTVSWTAAANAAKYMVYEYYQGVWAFLGSTATTSFQDINIQPNVGAQPSTAIPMFQTANDWPSVVGVYQQRLWFGNTLNQPQSYWASRVGQYGVFSVNFPSTAADAFTFVLAGKKVQFITAFSDIGKLVIHTSSGEYIVNGDPSGAATPTAQNVVSVGTAGSLAGLSPIAIGLTDIFVQANGQIVRDLQFDVQVFNYHGRDTSLFSSHLFAGKSVVAMAWQQVPNSILWCALSDGTLAAMTYIREHEMWAWHRHDTVNGRVESLCCVRENGVDALYLVIDRSAIGLGRVLERLHIRDFTDITIDACFTDSTVTYDGRNTGTTTLTVTTTTGGWTPTDVLTITASAATFAATDATYTNVINLRQLDAYGNLLDQINLTIIGYTSTTQVTATAQKTVPAWAQAALTTWSKAVSHFSGAANLANQTISVLGDGNIETGIAVDSTGAFVTQSHYLVAHCGLPITAQIQTLDWENQQGGTIAGKKKNINEITMVFVNSRGGKYGQSLTNLASFPQRTNEPWDTPNYLMTGPRRFPTLGQWASTAQVWVQQTDPLPMCLSAIIPTGDVGN